MAPTVRPAPPRLSAPALVDLLPVAPARLQAGEPLDGAHVVGADLSGCRLRETSWREAHLVDLVLDDADLRHARLVDVRLESSTASTVSAPSGIWRDVEVLTSRWGAAEIWESTWTSVVLRGCKLTYLNLRGATLTDVLVEDCVIETLDLQAAHIERMAIVGGRVTELLLAESTLVDVDLRGANLDAVVPATALAGATISLPQALALATGLAAGLGIDVR